MPKQYRPDINKSVGIRMRLYRIIKGLLLSQLVDKIGICSYQLAKYESGKSSIKAERIIQIAEALDIPYTYLVQNLELQKNMSYTPSISYGKNIVEILQYIASLSDEQRQIALENLRFMVEVQKQKTLRKTQ